MDESTHSKPPARAAGAPGSPPPAPAPKDASPPATTSFLREVWDAFVELVRVVAVNAVQLMLAATIATGMMVGHFAGGFGVLELLLTLVVGPIVGAVLLVLSLKVLMAPGLGDEPVLIFHPALLGVLLIVGLVWLGLGLFG